MAFSLSTLGTNASADAVCEQLDGGMLLYYNGSQPASANAAITTQTKIAQVPFGGPAFSAAVDGLATANAFAQGIALSSGEPTWFRCVNSGGQAIFDAPIADCPCSPATIQAGASVTITSFTYREKAT